MSVDTITQTDLTDLLRNVRKILKTHGLDAGVAHRENGHAVPMRLTEAMKVALNRDATCTMMSLPNRERYLIEWATETLEDNLPAPTLNTFLAGTTLAPASTSDMIKVIDEALKQYGVRP